MKIFIKNEYIPNRSEEIPLEDFQHSRNNSPHGVRPTSNNSNNGSRSHTPSRALNFEQISIHNASPRDNSLLAQVNGVVLNKELTLHQQNSSEETSFIANDDAASTSSSTGQTGTRRKGAIETV